jgi:hypothetical protein
VHDLYLSTIPTAAAIGRLEESRRLAIELVDVVADLTPHHRLHAAAILIETDELEGMWDAVVAREDTTIDAVQQNRDTPCVRNARSLLVCALARELRGERERSAELEELADELHLEGHGVATRTPRARLAIARGRMCSRSSSPTSPGAPASPGSSFLRPRRGSTSSRSSARRPREDDALVAHADALFRALGLDWHADQTVRLAELRKIAHS